MARPRAVRTASPQQEASIITGREARRRVARGEHGRWIPAADRHDPVTILEEQSRDRVPDLVPVRYGRMMVSPFTFYRGSAAVMAHDLGADPDTGLTVQLCGDAHLTNFGFWSTPERALIFGINDFDETSPGPFEWDVKRLAASVALVANEIGCSQADRRRATMAVGVTYQRRMAEFAAMSEIDLWYYRIDVTAALSFLTSQPMPVAAIRRAMQAAHTHDHKHALKRLTVVDSLGRRFLEEPPLILRPRPEEMEFAQQGFEAYIRSVTDDRQPLLQRYRLIDAARKVVGVGSVGTRCMVGLFEGINSSDWLVLQVKEATHSVLEPHVGPGPQANHGERVVAGQRLTQAASDMFLGWTAGPGGHHYYWRQLWDGKASIDPLTLTPRGLRVYATLCAWGLARAHAKTGDRTAISAYIGAGDRFAKGIADFSETYAVQAQQDHEALVAAVVGGRIEAMSGV